MHLEKKMRSRYFGYKNAAVEALAEDLVKARRDFSRVFGDETIKSFEKALHYIELAHIYGHRIDCLLSCEDGEEEYHQKLKEDLNHFLSLRDR